ncbi:Tetratricopeptide repeat-containing protein [Hymenobacter daecheongensis DSM 21074]|uniref:histidine kinase n=2 Tax=Hymenobacter daecheongensis TaxID=496053 RepID=A0A1M6EEI9_9BACT|nr:Tetratricopeptide repeat-containing protein [Hymenobacter daecheongensis DSM 21074]
MKILSIFLLWWLMPEAVITQADRRIDSLRHQLATAPPDTTRVLLLAQLAYEHTQTDPLATITYGKQALQLARQLGFRRGGCWALVRLGSGFREAGNYPAALQVGLQGLREAEALRDPELIGRAYNALGYQYWEQGNSRPALAYFLRAKAVAEKSNNRKLLTRVMGNIGNAYQQLNRLDSALLYLRQGYALDLSLPDLTSEVGDAAMLGNVYAALGQPALAQSYYRRSIRRARPQRITFALCRAYLGQARLFQRQGRAGADSALYYAEQALRAGQQGHYPKGVLEASQFLAAAWAARPDSATAFRYLTLASATRDSLFSLTKIAQLQALDVSERLRQQELADDMELAVEAQRRQWLVVALLSVLPVVLLLWRNIRLKQRANRQLSLRNQQIAAQRDELSNALAQLKTVQEQLVQRERMALLGELTAGIAHELQNPLNFVKNFAEVSTELLEELLEEHHGSEIGVAVEPDTLAGLRQNLQKISQHGQRASSIIKDMLEHSRAGSGRRTPTDLNALVEESLTLAYQSFCTTDKAFSATLHQDLDPNLGLVTVVRQDVGRVLLNLFANAFYAVRQRQQHAATPGHRPHPPYRPTVTVRTRRPTSQTVEIRVRDNGTGMPEKVQAKVFQPFFTTKPPGEGTGLGLSLSFDIVVQSHGGTFAVESREGEFTEFTISLPG